jgi:3-oxoacyl-[acyl-carrier-protein] synthase III
MATATATRTHRAPSTARVPSAAPSLPGTRTAAIAALGISLPSTIVRNAPIAERLGVSDEWIQRRTGIHSRRILTDDERLTDLAAEAGRAALESVGMDPAELDMLLVATTTADELLPNAAPLVAHALGASRAGAIDVGAACTGFLSGLAFGAAQIESGRAEHVLLIGADAMSRITDPDCRQTAALFADGAGAVVLSTSSGLGRIGHVSLGADGAGADLIVVDRDELRIRMQGQDTFRHAVARMSEATLEALVLAELRLEDIDLFVYHQANARILRGVGERLGLPADRIVDCIGGYANTSAATLPLALAHARDDGRLRPGVRVLLGAFGAGLTWGAAVIEWEIPELSEGWRA